MKILRLLYGASLFILTISFYTSSASRLIHPDFLIAFLLTSGIPLLLMPFISSIKAEKFYHIAKNEGRTRADTDKTPAPVEEEYRTDTILLLLLLSISALLVSYFLFKIY